MTFRKSMICLALLGCCLTWSCDEIENNNGLPMFDVGGSVSGLHGSLVLQNNGLEELEITEDGEFSFSSACADSETYEVIVLHQPTHQICSLTHGSGTVNGQAVTNIAVACADDVYEVGGTVSGLTGSLTVQNNEDDDLTLTENGAFAFATSLANGSEYEVTVASQPNGQTCVVSQGAGTLDGANITNVAIACTNNVHALGGTVSGLVGSVTLQNNGGDNLTLTEDGEFTFSSEVQEGETYLVSVSSQPETQTCTVGQASGTMAESDISNVAVSCATNTYTVGGAVSDLVGSVTLQNNGGDDLVLTEDGEFIFETEIADGSEFEVTVASQPETQTCTVSQGSGTVDGGAITNVDVTCVVNPDKMIFVTVTAYQNGNHGGISGADAKCMSDANYPGSGTFKALLVDGVNRVACTTANCSGGSSEHVDWVFTPNTRYVRRDATTEIVTTNANGIVDFAGGATLSHGVLPADDPLQSYIWTGLDSGWTTHANTCEGWTSTLGYLTGRAGITFLTSSGSVTGYSGWCDSFGQPARLYCVQQ